MDEFGGSGRPTMSRVDALIAKIESEKKVKKKKRRGKAKFALYYMVFMLLLVLSIELVGESFPAVIPLLFMPKVYLYWVPAVGLAIALFRGSVRGIAYNAASILLVTYLMSPVLFKGPKAPTAPTFTVMTYNMEDGKRGANSNAKVIEEFLPDVVMLQEANVLTEDENFRKAMLNGYHIYILKAVDEKGHYLGGGVIGTASRYPVDESIEIDFAKKLGLLDDKGKPISEKLAKYGMTETIHHRFAHIIKVRWNNQHIFIVNTHLSPVAYQEEAGSWWTRFGIMAAKDRYRQDQIEVIKQEIAKLDGPVIFGGDLNMVPLGKRYGQVRSNLRDTWRECGAGYGHTFSSESPNSRYDYIFVDENFEVCRAEVGNVIGSDHRSYMATVTLRRNVGLSPETEPGVEEKAAAPLIAKPKVEAPRAAPTKKEPAPVPKQTVKPTAKPKPAAKSVAKPVRKPAVKKAPVKKKPVVRKRNYTKRKPITRRRRG